MRYLLILLALTLVSALSAADAVKEFNSAMATQDSNDKKSAISRLVASSEGDDVVLPLLISAISDRQAGRYAIPALRARTGLRPSSGRGENQGYPGYPVTDDAAGWSSWLQQRKRAEAEAAKLKEALETAEEAKEVAEAVKAKVQALDLDGDGLISDAEQTAADESDADGDGKLNESEKKAAATAFAAASGAGAEVPEHLKPQVEGRYGKLDRVFFTDGSILRCYVITKRTDLQGRLTSVKIAHRDGGGEEIIDATLVARIEEDIE
ncbi:MAG: hypothetical protein PF961_16385 [Planctomycetota bacterium]|jgi:hypothetical protein|nr:hypothetical protein [Planctomycetota bacterium]